MLDIFLLLDVENGQKVGVSDQDQIFLFSDLELEVAEQVDYRREVRETKAYRICSYL